MNRKMRAEIAWVTTVKKFLNQSGSFENTPNFNWQTMEFFENRSNPLVIIAISNNPTKCVLNTLQITHVDTGQTSEKIVVVVQMTARQDICHQDSSLIRQVLSDPPEITYLNE